MHCFLCVSVYLLLIGSGGRTSLGLFFFFFLCEMTFSSHLPSSPASISICSFSPAGGFSKKFPHLLRLRLNGIPQAAFLPPPLTVKEDRGPPLSLHASLSSRLCPSVLLSNPPLSLSFFLFPPAGLHFNLTPGWREKKKKDSFAIRWLHGCTSLSVVETGSEGLTCSAVRPQLCRGDRTCLAAKAEVYRKYVRAFRGKKDKYAKHQTHLNDGTSRHRVIVSSSFRMFCFRVFFATFCNQNCTIPLLLPCWCLWCFSANVSHLKGCDESVLC